MPSRSLRRRRSARTLPFVVLLSALAPAAARAAPPADSKAAARTHFDQGVQLYKDGDFQAAAIEFRRAYDTEHNYRVLYNIGQACVEGKDYACAVTAYSSYLEQGGAEVTPARQSQLQQQIEKLRLRTGRLSIKTNVEGAAILIDDVAVGKTPLAASLMVSAGRRKVALVSPLGTQQLRTVEVAGGDDIAVEVLFPGPSTYGDIRTALDVTKDAPMEPGGDVGPDSSSSQNRKLAIAIPAILTGALLIGATFTGLEALDSKRRFDDAVANLPGDRDTIENERTRTRNWALTSDLMAGGAIVGGVITVIAILSYRSAGGDAAARGAAPAETTSFSFTLNSAAFTTRF